MNNVCIKPQWTPDAVGRFWDYLGSRTDLYPEYFSNIYGAGIVKFIKMATDLSGGRRVLDYGCGPGFLIEHLLREKITCRGFDFSEVSVNRVNERFASSPYWKGAISANELPLPFKDGEFDLVTCLETLEHLDDATLEATLNEISRVLAPGGMAVFTTPHDENLRAASIMCPFCNCEFHRVQHVRSFDRRTLAEQVERRGFSVLFCDTLDFENFQNPTVGFMDVSPRVVRRVVGDFVKNLLDRLLPRPFPRSRIVATYRGSEGHVAVVAVKGKGATA